MKKIGVINYGAGNFTSVWNAFSSLSKDIVEIKSSQDLDTCSHIVLPGVGTFGNAMEKIENMQIKETLIRHVLEDKKHFLGICVGMQILATDGFEFEHTPGLNLISGKVTQLEVDEELRLPHIGWNSVSNCKSPLFNDIEDGATFYFVHKYCLQPENPEVISATCDYGNPFAAAVSFENIHGVQFHPEKSQYYGLKLLSNFISLN